MTPIVALIFFVGITIGSLGGIMMKIGAGQMGHVELGSFGQMTGYVFKLLTNPWSFFGMVMYFTTGIIWSYLLIKLDISFVQPILALTYVLTPILAIVLLHENVPALRWIGILVIITGVVIVARSAA